MIRVTIVSMRPILFSFGRLTFYSYGFFTALGIIVGGFILDYLARKKRLVTKKQREYFLMDGLLLAAVSGIFAARLTYIVLYSFIFRTETLDLSGHLLNGGFVFYGGLIAALGAYSWWLKRTDEALMPWFDIIIIAILSGISINEFGGFLNDSMFYHIASSIAYLVMAGLTYIILVTEKRPGLSFRSGLFLLLLVNFFIGFWHEELLMWLGLSLGQWVSLLGLIATGTWWIQANRPPKVDPAKAE